MVTAREIVIHTEADEKVYDGTALFKPKYTLGGDGFLEGDGFKTQFSVIGSQTEVGSSPNGIDTPVEALRIVDANGEDVTHHYRINLVEGDLTVRLRTIAITTKSAEKLYDGTPLTKEEYTVTGDGLAVNQFFVTKIKVIGSQTDVGSSPNLLNVVVSDIQIMGAEGTVVTSNYEILITEGTLTVYKQKLTITTASDEKIFDGTPLTNPQYTIGGDGLLEGHQFAEELMAQGSQTEVGLSENFLNVSADQIRIVDQDGKDVTIGYELTVELGKLEVLSEDGDAEDGDGDGDDDGEGRDRLY